MRCLDRVRSKRPRELAELISDNDAQDVIVLNLSRAVQRCVDIGAHMLAGGQLPAPSTMGETFARLAEAGVVEMGLANRLRKAVGFRNIAVHNYDVVDWAIAHALSDTSLHDFEDFARQMVKQLPP